MPAEFSLEVEVSVLRGVLSLAHNSTDASAKAKMESLLGELSGYRWKDEEHRVVYECLRILGASHAKLSREELAAQATRMGHPDVDWPKYLGHESAPIDLRALINALKT